MTKVIIAGSRTIDDYDLVEKCIIQFISKFGLITEVICGEAKGVDKLGKQWALKNNIPVKSFYANWEKYRKSAGALRNKEMAIYASTNNGGCLAIQENQSRGTENMISLAEYFKLKTMIIKI